MYHLGINEGDDDDDSKINVVHSERTAPPPIKR